MIMRKRKFTELLALVVVLDIVGLSSCGLPASAPPAPAPDVTTQVSEQDLLSLGQTPAVSVEPTASPSQSVTFHVEADFSQLTPYEPMEEIVTRLSPGYMPELVPSDDYGPLLPYNGDMLYGFNEFTGASYFMGTSKGLVTMDGTIVTDAVYYSVDRPSYYNGYSVMYPQCSLYILKKADEREAGGRTIGYRRFAVCANDGSWVTPFDYAHVICCDQVMLLFRDLETNDFDAMDYAGKILYNSKELTGYPLLDGYHFAYFDGPSPGEFGGGWFVLWDYDKPGLFINEMRGDITNAGFTGIRGFSEGLAAAQKDGLWGYIDESFTFVIEPVFQYGDKFHGGKALVALSGDDRAVIDTAGNILLRTTSGIRRTNGFFEVGFSTNTPQSILDEDLVELFRTDEADFWNAFDGGYAFVQNGMTTVYSGGGKTTTLSGEYKVIWAEEGYMLCWRYGSASFRLMTLLGEPVAELDRGYRWAGTLHAPEGAICFALNANKDDEVIVRDSLFDDYVSDHYVIIDSQGRVISCGSGSAAVADRANLFSITSELFFGLMDTSGKYVFCISLLDSVPD